MSRRRLSAFDASFLEVESEQAHMHVGWAALFAPPEDRPAPRFDELRAHVGARLARAPRYRQKLAPVPLGMTDPVWVDDPEFDLARHVRHARGRDFQAVVDEVLSSPLPRDRPLWELWIADELDDGRIGAVGKVHHCMVDGIAAVELSSLMLDVTPDAPAEYAPWHPPRPPAPIELVTDALAARARQVAELAAIPVRLAKRPLDGFQLAGRVLRAAHSSMTGAPPSTLNAPISARRHLGCARLPLDELREVKRARGATVNDVLLAAVSGALRRVLLTRGEDPVALKAMVPVSVREEGAAGDLGNQISFVFVELPCDEADPDLRFERVQSTMGARKTGGEPEGGEVLLGALEYAPRPIQHVAAHMVSSSRTFNLVVSNIPGPPIPLFMCGCPLEEAYPVVPLADNHDISIGMTTVCGEAFLGVYADAESVPEADLLAQAVLDAVDELAPAGVGVPA